MTYQRKVAIAILMFLGLMAATNGADPAVFLTGAMILVGTASDRK